MKRATLDGLLAARADGRPVVLATWLQTGQQRILDPTTQTPPDGIDDALFEAARAASLDDRSVSYPADAAEVFLHVHNPPVRLIVVGAVHIAQPLVRMATLAGFEVLVVDPRKAFATAQRFPGVELLTDWPDAALSRLAPNRRTAVVTLTHDPKLDDPALSVALRSGAFFIGSLGSRRTHAKRLARLREEGFSDAELERINGPVGLNLGARTPAEIAVAILAQVVQTLRHNPT